MSTFEDDRYRWRETYFVLFPAQKRPLLKTVQKKLAALSSRYELRNLSHDEQGQFESLTLISPDDFAALDICFTCGPEVIEQGDELATELAGTVEPQFRTALAKIRQYDGRFDILHFEQIADLPDDEEDSEELLDPSALLGVLETLAKITGGIAVDPQSGTIIENQ